VVESEKILLVLPQGGKSQNAVKSRLCALLPHFTGVYRKRGASK